MSLSDIQFLCAQGIAYGINDISIKYSTIMLEILKWQKIIMKPYNSMENFKWMHYRSLSYIIHFFAVNGLKLIGICLKIQIVDILAGT